MATAITTTTTIEGSALTATPMPPRSAPLFFWSNFTTPNTNERPAPISEGDPLPRNNTPMTQAHTNDKTNPDSVSTTPIPRLSLNRKEAAKAIGLSVRKLDELSANLDSGIPAVRMGRKVLYPVDALTRWLNDHIGQTL